MKSVSASISAALLLSGCASVINDKTHPMKLETKTESGVLVVGADCTLLNDKSAGTVKSGDHVNVRRSNADLEISCKHPANPDATAKAVSRPNSGMFGNILIGGAIGAVIDHNSGSAYTYPTWVQLVFGRALVFDRQDEKDGIPVPATAARSASDPVEDTRRDPNKGFGK